MASQTPRFGLTKPALTDAASIIDAVSDNLDVIDREAALDDDLRDTINKLPAFATCATAAATAAKVVALPGFVLRAGAVIAVKFVNGNSAVNMTLNVEGTGAISVYRAQTYETVLPHEIAAGSEHLFVFDGAVFVMMSPGVKYAAAALCDTAGGTAAKVVTASGAPPVTSGLVLTVTFTNKNTAASPTVNFNGGGAKNIVDGGGANVSANAVPPVAVLSYTTAGKWLLVNPLSGVSRGVHTVPASAWTGNTATIQVPGITTDMGPAAFEVGGTTVAQKPVEAAAGLGDTDIIAGDGTITITATGMVPTVDLEIYVTIYGGA